MIGMNESVGPVHLFGRRLHAGEVDLHGQFLQAFANSNQWTWILLA
jgi:hypothetical protein